VIIALARSCVESSPCYFDFKPYQPWKSKHSGVAKLIVRNHIGFEHEEEENYLI